MANPGIVRARPVSILTRVLPDAEPLASPPCREKTRVDVVLLKNRPWKRIESWSRRHLKNDFNHEK
jgi:hypothetical protein